MISILDNVALPIFIIVLSNCFYHICSKSTPSDLNAFGALMVTYLIATILTGLILVYMVKPENVVTELSKINWTSIILGIAIVGLEAGYIFAYRLGGNVNTTPLIANTALAVALIIIGFILYNENITIKEITGIILCLIGMIIINI